MFRTSFRIKTTWPLWLLTLFSLIVLGDLAASLAATNLPPGMIVAALVLVLGAVYPLLLNRQKHLLSLRNGCPAAGMITLVFSAIFQIPVTSQSQLAALGLAWGVTFLTILFTQLTTCAQPECLAQSLLQKNANAMLVPDIETEKTELETSDELSQEEGELLQSWRRTRFLDGRENLIVNIRVNFQTGERIQHSHLPFSPPLQSIPHGWVECEDSRLQCTFSQLQTYGARLTIRRPPTELSAAEYELSIVFISHVAHRTVA